MFAAAFAPLFGKARITGCRALVRFEIVQRDADRDGDALTADDAFPVAQRRNRIQKAPCTFGHCGLDEGLIPVVVETHGNDRTALRQDAFGKIGWTLRNKAKRNPVFTAFLRDALQNLADSLTAPGLAAGNVTMRFFANEQDGPLWLITGPDSIIEHKPRQHGYHHRGDVGRHGRHIDDRNRLPIGR